MAKKPSDANYAALQQARNAYNSFYEKNVEHMVSNLERGRLTEVEIATRIPDAKIREEFVRRSIAMFEANVVFAAFDASKMRFEVPFDAVVLIAAAVLAVISYLAFGPAVAATVAFSYLCGYGHARNVAMSSIQTVESHNAGVEVHMGTLQGWERTLKELRALDSNSGSSP